MMILLVALLLLGLVQTLGLNVRDMFQALVDLM